MVSSCTVRIAVYDGPRSDLRPLFALAEDSTAQIDRYAETGEVLAAYDGDSVVGQLQLIPTRQPGEIEVKSLAVLPQWQGRGIGAGLVAAAVEHAAAAGLSRMVVSTAAADIGNLRFYQRTGFRFDSVEPNAFTEETGYPEVIAVDGIVLRDRVWFARELAVVLPGQDTLLACWQALAKLSPGASVTSHPLASVAVFPDWAPLNNAISTSIADRESAASQVGGLYRAAGVVNWALWLPSQIPDFEAEGRTVTMAGLRRDTTTLVMRLSLAASLRRHRQVVRTSIAAANLESDVPLLAAALDPPDGTPGLDGWVMLHEGRGVAAAWSFRHGTDCGLYAVETLPQWRRRGFARALVEHVLAEAYAAGAWTATLQSTPMGRVLYESLGFTAAGRYEEWVPR
jgi:GNAT superfamily N-acetyltransferase